MLPIIFLYLSYASAQTTWNQTTNIGPRTTNPIFSPLLTWDANSFVCLTCVNESNVISFYHPGAIPNRFWLQTDFTHNNTVARLNFTDTYMAPDSRGVFLQWTKYDLNSSFTIVQSYMNTILATNMSLQSTATGHFHYLSSAANSTTAMFLGRIPSLPIRILGNWSVYAPAINFVFNESLGVIQYFNHEVQPCPTQVPATCPQPATVQEPTPCPTKPAETTTTTVPTVTTPDDCHFNLKLAVITTCLAGVLLAATTAMLIFRPKQDVTKKSNFY
ncbi:minor membrane protein 2 [Bellinger River virus]|uniref:Minor membrane protein 2 n=1 Tax=Bellinger River virus TaxID=2301728 RepID=A0A346I7J2_9NIDO|nr:minor membrane protein 2 [Bellinger River virus]AXP11712.1 minor membrane protein 2 [Bellinger River virus]